MFDSSFDYDKKVDTSIILNSQLEHTNNTHTPNLLKSETIFFSLKVACQRCPNNEH